MHFNTNHTHSSAQTLTSGNSKQFGLFSDSLNLGYLGKNNSRNKSTTVKLQSTATQPQNSLRLWFLYCLLKANAHTLSSHTVNPTTYFHSNIPMLFTISYFYMCRWWQWRIHLQHYFPCFLQVFLSSHSIFLLNNVKLLDGLSRIVCYATF